MNDSFDKKQDSVYSKRLKAGKRRTYFFDVRSTRGNDYFLTITESRKRATDDGYDRHKIFLYKEDFHKFMKGLNDAVDFVKTELMPNFDFDSFNHEVSEEGDASGEMPATARPVIAADLLPKTAFDGMQEIDGHALDKAAIAPSVPTAEAENKPETAPESEAAAADKPTPGASHTEEVDRW